MSALGFSVDPDKQFGMAVQDVSLDFAKEMKTQNLHNLDTDKLIGVPDFGVDSKIYSGHSRRRAERKDSDKTNLHSAFTGFAGNEFRALRKFRPPAG